MWLEDHCTVSTWRYRQQQTWDTVSDITMLVCCFPKDTVLGGMWWIDMDWGFYFKQQEGYI